MTQHLNIEKVRKMMADIPCKDLLGHREHHCFRRTVCKVCDACIVAWVVADLRQQQEGVE